MADGVGEEVLEDAFDLGAVDRDRDRFDVHLDDVAAGVLGLRDAATDQILQVGGAPLRRHDPALQAVEVQQVRQQSLELAGVRGDPPEQVECVLTGHVQLGLFERERRTQDRGERGPQVVGDRLEERVLHLVECAQSLRRLALAPEGLGVLPLALLQRLLRAFALGHVHHETAQLSRPLSAAHHVDQVRIQITSPSGVTTRYSRLWSSSPSIALRLDASACGRSSEAMWSPQRFPSAAQAVAPPPRS